MNTAKTKVRIEVFAPLGACVCEFAPFMERISQVTSKFKGVAEVQMKSNKSLEASRYGIENMGIIVNGRIKLPQNFEERDLQDAISQEARNQRQYIWNRSIIMETSFEVVSQKYRAVKTGKTNTDLLRLKAEIELYIVNAQDAKGRHDDSAAEAQDMLIDVTQMIEESHCNPLRPKQP